MLILERYEFKDGKINPQPVILEHRENEEYTIEDTIAVQCGNGGIELSDVEIEVEPLPEEPEEVSTEVSVEIPDIVIDESAN